MRSLAGRLSAGALGIGVLVALVGGLVLSRVRGAVANLERGVYAQLATDARLRLDRLTSRDRTRLMEAAFADDLYALLERGPAPPDSFVRPTFIDRFVNLHGDRFIGLYNLNGVRLFAHVDSTDSAVERAATETAFLRTLDNREPAVGLLRLGERLLWIAGAPVLPTNYADATKPIRGYLIVAQPFQTSALTAGVADRHSAHLALEPMAAPKEMFRTQVETSTGDSVRVQFALADVFARQTTLASLTTSRAEFAAIDRTFRSLWTLALALAALVAALLWFVATRFLVSPAAKTSAALATVHRGELPNLLNAPSNVSEWTTITGAINRLITNGRAQSDKFDRLTGVVDDAAFEVDLASREWTVTARMVQLIGGPRGDTEALRSILHPDDATPVLDWLDAEPPSPRRLAVAVRFRAPGTEDWIAGRFEAEVGTDLAGQPVRVVGRLRDATATEALETARAKWREAQIEQTRRLGASLVAVAAGMTGDGSTTEFGHQLELIGTSLAGRLESTAEPFDLLTLLQEAAGSDSATFELSVIPGVPSNVIGDRSLLRTLVGALVALADRRAGRIALRADQPVRAQPELIRFVVEDRSTAPTWLSRVLEQGALDSVDRHAHAALVHHVVAALGGRTGIETKGERTCIWFELTLPAARVEAPAAPPAWETPAALDVPVEPLEEEAIDRPRETPSVTTLPVESQVPELVADTTVVIDFDAPPRPVDPVGAGVVAALRAGDSAMLRTARIALQDTPIRVTELKGAIRAGESRTVSQIAQAVRTIADALDARDMARRSNDILDAVEGQYLESADYLAQTLEASWSRVKEVIGPIVATPERTPDDVSAIDPATLDQLTATTTADGLGLGNQLISLFLAEAPVRIDSAERAIERGDPTGLRSAASDLKGMCGLVGATRLAEVCSAAVAAEGRPGMAAAVERMRTELRRVQEALEPLLGVRAGA